MKVEWSRETMVQDSVTGAWFSVFQLGTYAVKAEMPDGTTKIRVLPRATAIKYPDLPNDPIFAEEMKLRLATQEQRVVIEHGYAKDPA